MRDKSCHAYGPGDIVGGRTEAPVVRTEGLTKAYGRRADLSDLYLKIQPGEVFGYLGPNGAAKTTTLRLLAGMLRPTDGRAGGRTYWGTTRGTISSRSIARWATCQVSRHCMTG